MYTYIHIISLSLSGPPQTERHLALDLSTRDASGVRKLTILEHAIEQMNIRRKMPLKIRWKMQLKIHNAF